MAKVFVIDAHMVGERETGNETYILNFIRGLVAGGGDNRFVIGVSNRAYFESKVKLDDRFVIQDIPSSAIFRILFSLPKLVRRYRADFLVVTYSGPKVGKCKTINIIHDVIFRSHPEWFSPRDRLVLNLGVGLSICWSDLIITVSEFSKQDLEKHYPRSRGKIHMSLEGVDAAFHCVGTEEINAVRIKFGLRKPFVLAVGNLQPRKNIPMIIEAFLQQVEAGHMAGYDLVVVGKAQWREADVFRLVEESKGRDMIHFTGYVSDKDLIHLYNAADLFVYPSLYEGFGLPILEAMACGTAVLTSNTTSIPEVAGDAAVLVNPRSVEEIGNGMRKITEDPVFKAELVRRGYANLKRFGWDKMSTDIMGVLLRL